MLLTNVRNERCLISPSSDHCDSFETPCTTLSLLAVNTSSYLQSNTELSLLSGNHTLYTTLTVKHIDRLVVGSDSLSTAASILCVSHTAKFEFTNISCILISGVKFFGCGGNRVESVTNFALINAFFNGQQKIGIIALQVVNCTTQIENCSFISNSGGAMKVRQSNTTFLNCNFNKNHAERGGSIYGDVSSNISITNSTFCNNSAWKFGGAVFAGALAKGSSVVGSGMLSVVTSSFSYNKATSEGGAIATWHINVSVNESKFMSNLARSSTGGGGALLSGGSGVTIISDTVFESNNATTGCGGAVRMYNIKLLVFTSTFIQNSIKDHGGALCLQESTNELSDCTFNFNEAGTFGGAIYARNSHHTYLVRCSFDTNVVISASGGGRAIRIYREHLVITNSSFIDGGYLSYGDKHKDNTSNCQESNAGYRVSGVGLIMTSSTALFEGTIFKGSCESIYAYKCNINFTGNNSFLEIDNEQSKAPSALYIIQSIVSIDGQCTFKHNAAVSGGAIHASESRIDVNGELVIANNRA